MKISVCIPIYDMPNGAFFLKRAIDSVVTQTHKDYELIITKDGKMAENTNSAMKRATGDLIKILYMDDYLAHPNALKEIADNFKGEWMVTGCAHDPGTHTHFPTYNENIHKGINTIGSPSVLTMKNGLNEYFDESMTWLLDCDLYRRLHDTYGDPTILNTVNVVIGVGEHQTTHLMGEEIKNNEHEYMLNKYDTRS